jgi:hypothetical protein
MFGPLIVATCCALLLTFTVRQLAMMSTWASKTYKNAWKSLMLLTRAMIFSCAVPSKRGLPVMIKPKVSVSWRHTVDCLAHQLVPAPFFAHVQLRPLS